MSGIILVTGATGFVGKQIINVLLEKKMKVRIIVRSGNTKLINQERFEKVIFTENLFSESIDWWHEVCRDVVTVIHAAWYAEPGKYLESSKNLECLSGSLQMAQGAAKAGVRRFVGIGTCFEYDITRGWLTIDTPLKPTTLYGASKAAVFMTLSKFFSVCNVEFSWCRLFYLYGEGEDQKRLVPYLHAQLTAGQPVDLTEGDQIRDYLDVKVAGSMIAKVAMGKTLGPVNICSGHPMTIKELAERIADEYQRRDLLKFGAIKKSPSDPACVVGILNKEKNEPL